MVGWLCGSLQLFAVSHVIGLPNRKSWLAQGGSDRLVTLLDLPGKRFLDITEAGVFIMTDEGKESKSFGGSSYRNSPILCPKRLPPTGSSKHIVSGKKIALI